MKTILRSILALAIFAVALNSTTVHPLPDISGTGTVVQLTGTAQVNWIQIIADSGNTGTARFGDSTTSATVGIPLVKSAGYNTPVCNGCLYTLNAHYIYVANGDKVYVAFGQ